MSQALNCKQFKNIIIILIIALVLLPSSVLAVRLYLEPVRENYEPGDTFLVEIKIDTEGECINVVEANLSFSHDILNVIDFSQGNSILTLWLKPAVINEDAGLISFIGGIPGDYCGRVSGDPGPSNLLGKIIFRVPGMIVKEPGDDIAEIRFLDNSQVFLSDGLGTKANFTTQGAVFNILEKSGPLKREWQEELEKDKISPEAFEIEVHQEPSILEGKYFIIFSTTDKQTGVDYFEVKEGDKDWEKAISPYLLEDQSLQSIIKVKAVDSAGNEIITEYSPEIPKKSFSYSIVILILVGIGLGVRIAWCLIKNIKTRRSDVE